MTKGAADFVRDVQLDQACLRNNPARQARNFQCASLLVVSRASTAMELPSTSLQLFRLKLELLDAATS